MAVSTVTQPSHRLLGPLVVAILVLTILVSALLVARAQRSDIHVKPSAPAVQPAAPAVQPQTSGAPASGDDTSCFKVIRGTRVC